MGSECGPESEAGRTLRQGYKHMEKEYCTAIVLAAGSGRRMGTKVHKQYLLMGGRPVLFYPLKAFQDSGLIDEIILVTGKGEEEYCKETFRAAMNVMPLFGMGSRNPKRRGIFLFMTAPVRL